MARVPPRGWKSERVATVRNLAARPRPLPSVAHVPLDPPFAERFETDRLYRIPGERGLFCAQAVGHRNPWWVFHARGDFGYYGGWARRGARGAPHFYGILSGEPERVLKSSGYADLRTGAPTDLDWRAFVPTDYVRDRQRWRVYRPLKKATPGAPVR